MPPNRHAPVRARDLRANIAQHGFEKGVAQTLEHLLEEHAEMRQNLRTIAELTSNCIDQITALSNIGGAMAKKIDEVRRVIKQDGADDQKGQE